MNLIRTTWNNLKSLFLSSKKCENTDTSKKLHKLSNSCALVALARVCPSLSYEQISDAFYNCCKQWPQAGVTHKEFNIILRYLNIFDKFLYSEEKLPFHCYINNKNSIYILLIPGHFTVFHNNKIYDNYGYSNLPKNTIVYCSWYLL